MATKTATKSSKASAKPAGRPVVVMTEYKGVFFGFADETSGDVIHLKQARNCVSWSSSIKGVFDLAATGPDKACRIGPAVDFELRKVTAVVEATPEAVEAWQKGFWG